MPMTNSVQTGKCDMGNKFACTLLGLTVSCLLLPSTFAALSSSSYIQEGLIFQLDGVENVSRGSAHQAAATTWTDLVGGEFGFAVSGSAAFVDGDALSVARNWSAKVTAGEMVSKVETAFAAGSYTAEIAYDQTAATETTDTYGHYSCRLFMFGHPRYWMGIGWNNSNQQKDCWVGASPKGMGREPNLNWIIGVGPGGTLGQHTLSLLQGSGKCSAIFDTTEKSGDVDPTADAYSMSYGLILNGFTADANDGMTGRYHSIRFYDRPLTDDERAINRAVDQVRYFGADASALTLPEGWRFSGTGAAVKLECRHYAHVFEGRGGAVEIVNATETDVTEFWIEHNVPTAVTFRATPASGYEFRGWLGLSDTSKKNLTEVTDVVIGDVTAVFVYVGEGAQKLSALNYVTNGLVGHWDGIENVGYGLSHDTTAQTAWKDLRGTGADFSVPEAFVWNDTGLTVIRSTCSYTANKANQAFAAYNAGAYTCEMVYDKSGETPSSTTPAGKTYTVLLGFYYTTHFWFGLDGETVAGFHPNYASYSGSPNGLANHTVTVEDNKGRHVLSCAQDGPKTTVRFDRKQTKEVVTESEPATKLTRAEKVLAINCNYGSYDTGLNGTVHAIRFYNRAISADEYAVNCALDEVRFFGANPVECDLPADWRFNLSNGISMERRRVAGVNDPTMGKVRAGDGEAGTSVDCWVDGATETVTLTAIPAEGCKFVRWRGAITGGDLRKSTGVFTVTGDVTAEFKTITGLMLLLR